MYTSTHTIFGDMSKRWTRWRSGNQQENRHERSRRKNEKFFIKKDNERLAKDMIARKIALEKLGIRQNFNFEDHKEIYCFNQ